MIDDTKIWNKFMFVNTFCVLFSNFSKFILKLIRLSIIDAFLCLWKEGLLWTLSSKQSIKYNVKCVFKHG